jgi:hypothetical protein
MTPETRGATSALPEPQCHIRGCFSSPSPFCAHPRRPPILAAPGNHPRVSMEAPHQRIQPGLPRQAPIPMAAHIRRLT